MTCEEPAAGLNLSKKYRLIVRSHTQTIGLRKPKSNYIKFKNHAARWENPFGPRL